MSTSKNVIDPAKKSGELNYVLVIHGGTLGMPQEDSTPENPATYKAVLSQALKAGYNVLKQGGEAMDAVVAAVSVMEDCPLFNSGHGAVFNVAGKIELESSLMVSKPPASHPEISSSRRGSSITLITHTRNPSHLARALYLAPEVAPHPMMSGAAAEAIGASLSVRQVDPSYFWTEVRWREHRRGLGLPEEPVEYPSMCVGDSEPMDISSCSNDKKVWKPLDLMPTGTVGAVALDTRGCIAALTSTGGRTNKLVGRVGDTSVMGCGFWAEEWRRDGGSKYEGVGVSGTGDGDYYIRRAVASNIARRMQYLGESLAEATQYVIDDLSNEGGLGGVIALDRDGNVAVPLNCSGMYRGVIRPNGIPLTAIFPDEQLSEL